MKRTLWRSHLAALLLSSLALSHPTLAASNTVQLFDLAQVRLLDGPFKNAQDRTRDYLLAHDVHRFIAPFRTAAGLEPKAPQYPNWESSGLDGHSAGHYLTALAQMWAATGDAEMKRRLNLMVTELAECQQAVGNGYLGGIPGGRELWKEIAGGQLQIDNFSVNGKWVPWYNLHKTFAGLRDAWLIGHNTQARELLIRYSQWCRQLCSHLSEAQMQEMLRAEHGGMNEVLADVYAITGDHSYLTLAQRFSHHTLLEPLLRHEDALTGLHANTQIPKAIGFARIAELGGDASWHNAAAFFWNRVAHHRTVAFGGNSVREHFNPVDDCSTQIESREGPETCNTHNMLRLTELLYRNEPAALYGDYYERALYNHILSSVHPQHGGLVYFTPLRPQHYRVYSQPGQCFWCCVGSGIENHGKYGRFIYAHQDDALYVNLFIPSELHWPDRNLLLRQETRFPDQPRTSLLFSLPSPQHLSVHFRHPGWMQPGDLHITINGEPHTATSLPRSFETLTREWHDGDRVDIELPMHTRAEHLPDGSDYVALLHGPILLAAPTTTNDLEGLIADDARFAHIAPGRYFPLDTAPMLVGKDRSLAEHIHPVPGEPLTFSATDLIQPNAFQSLRLVPFFRVHDTRYVMYWHTVTPEHYPEVVARLEIQERQRLALEARTLDQVTPGEQQPEVEHHYQGENSNTGRNLGRPWRDTADWFSYDLQGIAETPLELIVTYFAGERRRHFDILVNNQPIATVQLNGGPADSFRDESYPVPAEITAAAPDGVLTVKFVARERSRAGAIYGLRLTRVETSH